MKIGLFAVVSGRVGGMAVMKALAQSAERAGFSTLWAPEHVVLLDPGVQYSVTCSGIQEGVSADGRLEVGAQIHNRENRRIEVQVNCVFKDANGYSTGDETPFQTLILTENATEHLKFTAMNTLAKKYTIRVRQAR